MKDRNMDNNQSGLTRRQPLGMATLTGAGLAAASMGRQKRRRNLRTWSQLNYTREDWILCRSAGLPENRNGDPE